MKTVHILIAALVIVSAAVVLTRQPMPAAAQAELVSAYISAPVPTMDPNAPDWGQAAPLDIPLGGATVGSLQVRSVNDGSWIGFLLEWEDATQDTGIAHNAYKDAAAVQLPHSTANPAVCMGMAGQAVSIMQWRADFQHDVDEGFPTINTLYPNLQVSTRPADGGFVTARQAGNPQAQGQRSSPVEDLMAGGPGTLTPQGRSDALGKGVWKDGKWLVVIARPLATSDVNDVQLMAGGQTTTAFAVWEGGSQEVDGRKAVSSWVTLSVEAAAGARAPATTTPGEAAPLASQPLFWVLVVVALLVGAAGGAALYRRRAGTARGE